MAPQPAPQARKLVHRYHASHGTLRHSVPKEALRARVPEALRDGSQCEEALALMRWPNGFRCPRCEGAPHGLVYGRRLRRYQCRQCGHQATVTAGTVMEATLARRASAKQ